MAPAFSGPGVFTEETPNGPPGIVPAGTSVAAFIDTFRQGPLQQATRVESWAEFTRIFGGLATFSEASYGLRLFFLNGGATAWVVRVDGDATPDTSYLLGDGPASGLSALDAVVPLFDLLCVPAITTMALDDAAYASFAASLIAFCEVRRAFLILDPPRRLAEPVAWEAWARASDLASPNGALYVPSLEVPDPLQEDRPRPVGASGAVAGIFARTDARRGVWKAPAGLEATLTGGRVAVGLTDADQDRLNPIRINVIRTFPEAGTVVWGARTLAGADTQASEWKYVPVRRTALFIERSVLGSLGWTAFEPNGAALWTRIRDVVDAFMAGLFRAGAFQGRTPTQAYFVKCDARTVTSQDIADGVAPLIIGFAPLKPDEFVTLRLEPRAGAAS